MIRFKFTIICDRCGKTMGFEGLSLNRDGLQLIRIVMNGWVQGRDESEHYCPDCATPSEKLRAQPQLL